MFHPFKMYNSKKKKSVQLNGLYRNHKGMQPSPQFENIFITPETIPPHLLAVTLHFPSILPSSRLFWTLHINGLIKYVVSCALLLSSHDALKIHPHCGTYQYFISLYCWVIFCCMDKPYLIYLFISLQTFGFFPPVGLWLILL